MKYHPDSTFIPPVSVKSQQKSVPSQTKILPTKFLFGKSSDFSESLEPNIVLICKFVTEISNLKLKCMFFYLKNQPCY